MIGDTMFTTNDLKDLLKELRGNKEKVAAANEGIKHANNTPSDLQLFLLQNTLKYVYANCNYYRHIYTTNKISVLDVKMPKDLSRLPLTKREDLEKHVEDFISAKSKPGFVGRTSGTTTGTPMIIYRSAEEVEADRLLWSISSSLSETKKKTRVGVILSQNVLSHGSLPPIYHQMLFISSQVDFSLIYAPFNPTLDRRFDGFIKILQTQFCISKHRKVYPTALYGSPLSIELITREMINRNLNPSKSAIEHIGMTGSYIPSHRRRFIADSWNGSVYNTYSMAEHCGTASTCANGDLQHFSISCIPEVIDIGTQRQLDLGQEGVMVLTSLYPFQQCVPLIRYLTGDIVILTNERCSICGYEGISIKEFVGRVHRCLDLSEISQGKNRFVSSAKTYDVLSKFPEFTPSQNTVPRFNFVKSNKGGNLKVKIQIEVFNHAFVKDNRLRENIMEQVMRMHSWDKSFPSVELDIEFLPPFAIPTSRPEADRV